MLNFLNTSKVSSHVSRRADLMWVRRQRRLERGDAERVYDVCPHGSEFNHKAKAKRRVTVNLIFSTAICVDKFTGEPCQANADHVLETGQAKEPSMCCHVLAVLRQIAKNENRKRQEDPRAA